LDNDDFEEALESVSSESTTVQMSDQGQDFRLERTGSLLKFSVTSGSDLIFEQKAKLGAAKVPVEWAKSYQILIDLLNAPVAPQQFKETPGASH
jgi:hypothetical protein